MVIQGVPEGRGMGRRHATTGHCQGMRLILERWLASSYATMDPLVRQQCICRDGFLMDEWDKVGEC